MPIGDEPPVVAFLALLRIGITVFCAVRAGQLNRSRLGWGLFGFFIPLLAVIVILFMRSKQRGEEMSVSSPSPPISLTRSSPKASDAGHSVMDRASKKMLRHGPGSPGETAEMNARIYLKFKPDEHRNQWKDTFTIIAGMRFQAWMMNRIVPDGLTPDTLNQLVERSEGDLACLTFFLMYIEAEQFRKNILAHEETFKLASDVMYETVQEIAPVALTKSLDAFRLSALSFAREYEFALA